MAKLIATALTSLDGYVNDERGEFRWAEPDEEVLAFVNELERPLGTYLYGRRLYETMVYWETYRAQPDEPQAVLDYAKLWLAADKVVYSSTLEAAGSSRTRIERAFDPGAVRAMKETAGRDLSIGGPTLAAHAFRAGLVDEVRLLLSPVSVGGGTRFLPAGQRLDLRLLEERRFGSGVVYVRYRVSP